jgi:hypothetical protein
MARSVISKVDRLEVSDDHQPKINLNLTLRGTVFSS